MASHTATMDETSSVYAGFWRRVAASMIDSIIMGIIVAVAMLVFGGGMFAMMIGGGSGAEDASAALNMGIVLYVGLIIVWLAYKAGLECSSRRATLGKMALGIIVTDMNGEGISFLTSLWRNWPVWLPGIVMVAGMAMISPGDMAAMSSGEADPAAAAGAFGAVSMISNAFGLVALIAYLVVAFTPKKQGLHDIMAKALVVRKSAL